VGDVTGLVERLEKATGPDREIDAAIRAQLGISEGYHAHEFYTASLDAALALVERVLPGWRVQFWQQRSGSWHVRLIRDAHYALVTTEDEDRTRDGDNEIAGARSTPALALCLAALKALAQGNEGSDEG